MNKILNIIESSLNKVDVFPTVDKNKLTLAHISFIEGTNKIFYPRTDGGYIRRPVKVMLDTYLVSSSGFIALDSSEDVAGVLVNLHDFNDVFNIDHLPKLCRALVKGKHDGKILTTLVQFLASNDETIITISVVVLDEVFSEAIVNKPATDYIHKPNPLTNECELMYNINGVITTLEEDLKVELDKFIQRNELKVSSSTEQYAYVISQLIIVMLNEKTFGDLL